MAEVGSIGAISKRSFAPRITEYRMGFTTASDGAVSGITIALEAGELVGVKVVPNTGDTQPTAAFDLTLLDADGLDLLGGEGADLINSGPTMLKPATPAFLDGSPVQPTIAAGGDSKTGELVLFLRY